MRATFICALLVLLVGCRDEPPKPVIDRLEAGNLSDEDLQRVTSTFPGMTKACAERVRAGGIEAIPRETDQCFKMTARQRWHGLWRDAFEGSRFCPAPATECSDETPGKTIWLRFADEKAQPKRDRWDRGLFAIDFEGRRTLEEGAFGHVGMFDHEIIVDHVISMKQVEAPPKE